MLTSSERYIHSYEQFRHVSLVLTAVACLSVVMRIVI